ncbi:hypothetical protein JYB62_01790 [Algoriphagus lutimaris]|uniref:hypothetical protein n=1 Tax=Algoriphagus lutimaris TaxID=613197 RepID=UPI00196B721F|nr:hypothetical protein [Algoriphagus lutimaris]MBN3518719.1 hypothetical protein [Algoriphagus lutimaris]
MKTFYREINLNFNSKTWLWLGILIMVGIWNCPWRYQVNDDVIMMWLVSGAYTGKEEFYAVFIHPILSYSFSFLYRYLNHTFSWYSLFMYAGIFYSYYLIQTKIEEKAWNNSSKFLFKILILAICSHLCIFPQFTLISGWLALASWCFIIDENEQPQKKRLLLFFLGISCSMMIRIEAFLLVSIGVFYYYFLIINRNTIQKRIWIIVLFLAAIFFFSKNIFENNSEFKDYLIFNKLRHQVIDHPVFYENSKDDLYKQDSKWYYFSKWYFQDSEIGNPDLVQLKTILDKSYLNKDYIIKSFSRFWEVQTSEMFKGFISILLILLFVISFPKRNNLIFFGLWIVMFFSANHLFHLRGRVVFLFFIVLLFPLLENSRMFIKSKLPIYLGVVIILFLGAHFSNFWKESIKREKLLSEYDQLIKLKEDDEFLMLEGFSIEYFSKRYNKENQVPFFIHGWVSRSPFQKRALNRLGYASLKEVEKFDLIVVNEKAPFDTKNYMEQISSNYIIADSIITEELTLFKYSRK